LPLPIEPSILGPIADSLSQAEHKSAGSSRCVATPRSARPVVSALSRVDLSARGCSVAPSKNVTLDDQIVIQGTVSKKNYEVRWFTSIFVYREGFRPCPASINVMHETREDS
jgi:hypothetical protein